MSQFERCYSLLGNDYLDILGTKHIAVFGIGGVGSYVCEALARTGVGEITIVDSDVVSESNINRQIIALHSTVGQYKTDVMKSRIADINPDIKVNAKTIFYTPQNNDEFDFSKYDYVVDAIDTVTAKLDIIKKAYENNIPIISCMGTGNKLDATQFKISDISKTNTCPLARVIRRELKKLNIPKLNVLWSSELPKNNINDETKDDKPVPGSVGFVPSVAGLIIAGYVICDTLKIYNQ